MAEKWTNTSAVPSSGAMKPKPLSALNHFTVPVAISPHPLVRNPSRDVAAPTVSLPALAPAGGHALIPGLLRHWPLGQPSTPARVNALLRHSPRPRRPHCNLDYAECRRRLSRR